MSVVLSVCTWHLSLPSQVKLWRGRLKPRGLRNKKDPLWKLGIVLCCCYSSFTHCLCERSREHCAWMKCARARFFFAASAVHRDLYLHISVTPCEMPSCQVTRTSASPRLTMFFFEQMKVWRGWVLQTGPSRVRLVTCHQTISIPRLYISGRTTPVLEDGQAWLSPDQVPSCLCVAASVGYLCHPDAEHTRGVFSHHQDAFSASSDLQEQCTRLTATCRGTNYRSKCREGEHDLWPYNALHWGNASYR